jgi:hypothetical protein
MQHARAVGILFALALLTWTATENPVHADDPQPRRTSPAEMYEGMRSQVLASGPEAFGLARDGALAPYGVVMETGYREATVAVVSFISGDASVYISHGGGFIGGIGHATVRRAAQDFVSASAKYLPAMQKTDVFPGPADGQTRFFVLTTHGVFTAEAPEQDLGYGRSDLSPLFHAGQDVLTAIRPIWEQAQEQQN